MKILKKHLFFFSFLSFTLPAFPQGIQDTIFQIQEVVTTSKKIFKKEEAGMKEVHMDTLILQENLNVNLSNLLEQSSTVYIKSYGRGALATVSFRGTAATHTKVTWNGMPINSPMLGMVDFSTIPVYVLDDISIQYGGSSISSNSGALGGNVNLGNVVDWQNRVSGRVLLGYGSYSTYNGLGQINLGNKKIQSKTRIYTSNSANDYNLINTYQIGHPSARNENGKYGRKGALQEFYWRMNDKWISSAKAWYQNIERSLPMVLSYEGSDTAGKSNSQTDITLKTVADAKYYGKKLEAKIRSGYDYQQLDYVMSVDIPGQGTHKPVNSGSDMHSLYNHAEMSYKAYKDLSFKTSADVNHFDITSLDSTNQTGYDVQRTEYSVFAGVYYHLWKPVNVSMEFRRDFIPDNSPPLIYNFGLSIKPFSNSGLVWKGSFCRNYHSPTLNDLFWVPGGNPDLVAEEGHTGETGLHYLFNTQKSELELQLTVYYSDINNWILWLPSIKGYWEAINLKRVVSKGIELNIKYAAEFNNFLLKTQANYSYASTTNQGDPLNSVDESVGMQLPFIPENSFNALVYLKYNRAFITYKHQLYGVRNLLSSNMATLEDDSDEEGLVPFYRLYAVPLQNMSLGYEQPVSKYSILAELKINNLFNESYRNVLNRFMPGINFNLLLTFKF